MTQHTPGPWTVQNLEPSTIGHDWVDGPNRRRIAVCSEIVGSGPHGYCQLVDTDEIAANARLISAAPDLLDALKRMVDVPGGEDGDFRAIAAARAAIAKATGEGA